MVIKTEIKPKGGMIMYNIKNHRMNYKFVSDVDGLWTTDGYIFCCKYIAESHKILYYKNSKVHPDSPTDPKDIDKHFDNMINSNSFIPIKYMIFTGEVKDGKKVNFLWEITDINDMKHYFDSKLIGWLLYRLNKLNYRPITYKIDPDRGLLLFKFDGDIVGGIIGF